jgi:hypothetical protein
MRQAPVAAGALLAQLVDVAEAGLRASGVPIFSAILSEASADQ